MFLQERASSLFSKSSSIPTWNNNMSNLGVSENGIYPIVPNGFADHYPVFKWLAIIGNIYPTFSDKPIYIYTQYMYIYIYIYIYNLSH